MENVWGSGSGGVASAFGYKSNYMMSAIQFPEQRLSDLLFMQLRPALKFLNVEFLARDFHRFR
ncbi:MAG TPA: hypothetical protein DHV38_08410 [Corynebacterium casei]|nr:hypothetical protein [Corynebacterium casei]